VLLGALAGSVLGCATYKNQILETKSLIRSGQFENAIEKLKQKAELKDRDQLLSLMDYATVLSMVGRFEESSKILIQADRLAEEVDYQSVSKIALATLSSEDQLQFKGDSFEKLMINSSLALNFLAQGKNDSALIEARRMNEKIKKLRSDGRDSFEFSPWAHYMAAIAWEADGKFDDAFLEYKAAYQLSPEIEELKKDYLRTSRMARRMDVYKQAQADLKISENPKWYDKSQAQIILIYESGWGPYKTEAPGERRLATLAKDSSRAQQAMIEIEGLGEFKSQDIYSIEDAAIKALEADHAWAATRKVGAFVAKEIVADQIRQKDALLGLVAQIAMHVSDRADLRCWGTLPAEFQVARIFVKPGQYKVNTFALDSSGQKTSESSGEKSIQVKSGQIRVLRFRSLQ
jgi:uncharacterized protein